MGKYILPLQQDGIYKHICRNGIKKKKSIPFSPYFYKSLTSQVDGKPLGEFLKLADTSGYCYFYSLLLASGLKNAELKYGVLNVLNTNINDCYYEEFGHGWVEEGSAVYDTTCKQVFNKDWYYKNFEVTVKQSIPTSELAKNEVFEELLAESIKERQSLKPLADRILQERNMQNE